MILLCSKVCMKMVHLPDATSKAMKECVLIAFSSENRDYSLMRAIQIGPHPNSQLCKELLSPFSNTNDEYFYHDTKSPG